MIYPKRLLADCKCVMKQVCCLFVLVLVSVNTDTDGTEKTCAMQPKVLTSVNKWVLIEQCCKHFQ